MTEPNFWKRKLAAYLHDPPEKAYDFGPHHQARATVHAESFGVSDLWKQMGGDPDWSAAAADRFVLPHGSKAGSLSEDGRIAFVHPTMGRTDDVQPALPCSGIQYPDQAAAEQWLGDIRPEWRSEDPHTLFLNAWRNWSDCAAGHHAGSGCGAELLPYLPADTRVPDGSIWHHCAVVSALEGARESSDRNAPLKPAFLLFQVGPVQDFIAQARSTRDLWSGSYLLSWLVMQAVKAVADCCGPDALIFPSLKGQPLYDFLETRLRLHPDEDQVLVPGIPNRFLALVPESFDVDAVVVKAFKEEWNAIARECLAWLRDRGLSVHEALWHEQLARHWHITWQMWPWQSANDAVTAFKSLPLGRDNPIHLARLVALGIPEAHRDDRCYREGKLNAGWAWSAHYQLCQHALDARRTLREFTAVSFDALRRPGHRDALSGREEAVVQADHLGRAAHSDIRYLFRHPEPLGAANVIKRVWHKAYLERLNDVDKTKYPRPLARARLSFDSVPAVAAGKWMAGLKDRLARSEGLWLDLISLSEVLDAARTELQGTSIPRPIVRSEHSDAKWLAQLDAEVFTSRFWDTLDEAARQQMPVKRAAEKVSAFKRDHRLGEPPAYYAVLALDGDQVGRWLGGERSPAVKSVLSPKAVHYFRERMLPAMTESERETFADGLRRSALELERPADWQAPWPPATPEAWIEAWLASPRPISPSWHLQFSEALANFGLHAVRCIVENVHHGQLIFSGGDDVLAMLPAEEAIDCATNLKAAFQGKRGEMSASCAALFRADAPDGFLWLANPGKNDPSWRLLVPGPRMTVSVGIAIGHVKDALQDMVAEAQFAEKRAKADPQITVFDRSSADPAQHQEKQIANAGWGRDALAVTLFKRSGETIHWGAKFGSSCFALLRLFQENFRVAAGSPDTEQPISGKFPHRIAEMLAKFGPRSQLNDMAGDSTIADLAEAEVIWIIKQQTRKSGPIQTDNQLDTLRQYLIAQCRQYLDELRETSRPLAEFINLFLTEAFLRRQAD